MTQTDSRRLNTWPAKTSFNPIGPMNTSFKNDSTSDDFRLYDVIYTLMGYKRMIVAVTLIITIAALTVAYIIPKQYSAQTLVSPVSNTPGGGGLGTLNSLASQFGGLASIAGISPASDAKKSESIATLQSESLTEAYIQSNNLLPVLFASKWDARANKWKVTDPKEIPTLWKGNSYFKNNVRAVTIDLKSGLLTLTIKWKDPHLAAKWANDLIREANQQIRARAISDAEKNIGYLTAEAAKSPIVEAKQAIYALMETEINKEMLARGSEEYAFKIIDPATSPEKPSFPNKIAWLLGGIFGGFTLAVTTALAHASWRRAASHR